MAEVIFRFPSKVPYGYVEVKMERTMSGVDSVGLAQEYAREFLTYREAEAEALAAPKPAAKAQAPSVDEVLNYNGDGPGDVDAAATELIKNALGATELDDDPTAPWNDKPEPEEKPYVAPPSASDWEFS